MISPRFQVQRMRCEATWEDKASAVLRSLREQESRGEGPGERSKTWIWPLQNEIIEIWLVVWNILEHEFDLFYILGMSSSQLTFTYFHSIIIQRGWSTTSHEWDYDLSFLALFSRVFGSFFQWGKPQGNRFF